MAFKGPSYRITAGRGILFFENDDKIPSIALADGSKNLELISGGWEKRRGSRKVHNGITGSPRIMGIYDFRPPGGAAHVLVATADGRIMRNPSTAVVTGLTNDKITSFETFSSEVYVCNGADTPLTWDGVTGSMTPLQNTPTDWTAGSNPSHMLRHGSGNSERMWAAGCPGNSYTIYVSPNGNGKDFSDANVNTIRIDTGDNFGIVRMIEHLDKIFAIGNRQTYVIDDADPNPTNWGYIQAPWYGGVGNLRLAVKTPNDIILMDENLEIYSVSAAQQYGDYEAASLTRPSFMHDWIRDNVRKSYIDHFHGIYDPSIRGIRFWVVKNGQTTMDTCLVLFLDLGAKDGWMIQDGAVDSGYFASASAEVRVGAGNKVIYTGDYSGVPWELSQDVRSDDVNSIYAVIRSKVDYYDSVRQKKSYKRMWIDVVPKGTETILVDWWVDGVQQQQQSFTVSGSQTRYSVPLGAIGETIEIQLSNNTAGENIFVKSIIVDYKPLGGDAS